MKNLSPAGACLALLILTAPPAPAQQTWQLAQGDEEIAPQRLAALLHGRRILFEDGSRGRFRLDGSYLFTAADGESWLWEEGVILSDGSFCVKHEGTVRRCDLFVMNAGELVLINGRGQRYRATLE